MLVRRKERYISKLTFEINSERFNSIAHWVGRCNTRQVHQELRESPLIRWLLKVWIITIDINVCSFLRHRDALILLANGGMFAVRLDRMALVLILRSVPLVWGLYWRGIALMRGTLSDLDFFIWDIVIVGFLVTQLGRLVLRHGRVILLAVLVSTNKCPVLAKFDLRRSINLTRVLRWRLLWWEILRPCVVSKLIGWWDFFARALRHLHAFCVWIHKLVLVIAVSLRRGLYLNLFGFLL